MTFPNFLGIGAERCGSTWLHLLLKDHPEIYMPIKRKEIDYFSHYFYKGLDWYESFFPDEAEAQAYKAIGEFSPSYLNFPKCAKRIAHLNTINKLILILRDPIQRTYSHYGQALRQGYEISFEDYLKIKPEVVNYGLYGQNLERFLNFYTADQILCLTFEMATKDVKATKEKIGTFLNVDPGKFPNMSGYKPVNEAYVPKFKKLSYLANSIRNKLIISDMDWAINLAKKAGIQNLLKAGSSPKSLQISQEVASELNTIFAEDIERLEKLINLDLSHWKARH